jgi:DNA polymerase-3 subunit gamma/tau
MIRAALALELGGVPPEIGERARTALEERKGRLAATDLVRMLGVIVEHEPIFKKSTQQQLLFESMLVRFALLDRTVELEDVLRAFGDQSSVPRSAGPRATPAPRSMQSSGARETLRDSAPPPRARAAASGAHESTLESTLESALDTPAPAVRQPARPAPRVAPANVLADATPAPASGTEPLDVNRLAERWDDIIAELRAAGRSLVAQLLEETTPAAVTADGTVTLDAETEMTVRGLGEAQATVLEALRKHFAGVSKISVRAVGAAPRRRYDASSVKAERTETLRKADPLLAAAIDALDLELLE